jgi:hypothetical protein
MSTDAVAGAATLYAYGAAALLKQLLLRQPPPALDATCGIEGGAATSERCVSFTSALVIPLPHSHHVQMRAASNRTRYTRLRQVCFLSLVCFSCASFLCVLTRPSHARVRSTLTHIHQFLAQAAAGRSCHWCYIWRWTSDRCVCVCVCVCGCVCVCVCV